MSDIDNENIRAMMNRMGDMLINCQDSKSNCVCGISVSYSNEYQKPILEVFCGDDKDEDEFCDDVKRQIRIADQKYVDY